MEKRDLRLGNIVHTTQAGRDGGLVEHVIESGADIDNAHWYFEVPLTEDTARRLGLKERKVNNNFSFWHIGVNPLTHDWLFCLSKHKDADYFFFQNAHHKIMYVHHAQNLAYDLTGLELTLKEN